MECKYWSRRGCARPNCKFSHPEGKGRHIETHGCWYRSLGICRYGDKCRHEKKRLHTNEAEHETEKLKKQIEDLTKQHEEMTSRLTELTEQQQSNAARISKLEEMQQQQQHQLQQQKQQEQQTLQQQQQQQYILTQQSEQQQQRLQRLAEYCREKYCTPVRVRNENNKPTRVPRIYEDELKDDNDNDGKNDDVDTNDENKDVSKPTKTIATWKKITAHFSPRKTRSTQAAPTDSEL